MTSRMVEKRDRFLPVCTLALLVFVCLIHSADASKLLAPSVRALLGNGIGELASDDQYLWAGTDAGVSRISLQASLSGYSSDSGDWTTFTVEDGIGGDNITALAVGQGEVWIAAAHDSTVMQTEVSDGISVTRDGGRTWQHFRPERGFGLANTVWGLAVSRGTVWAATWNAFGQFDSGLIRSRDGGQTWESLVPNSNPNGEFSFAVLADGPRVWVGTAGGIARTSDEGVTWDLATTGDGLTGNWVYALDVQEVNGDSVLWAGSWPSGPGERYGVVQSTDGGVSWTSIDALLDVQAVDFAFSDDTLWAATFDGLWSSSDGGNAWIRQDYRDGLAEGEAVSVHVLGENVWVGSSQNGLSLSADRGRSWRVIQTSFPTVSLGSAARVDTIATYAFPNPYSPVHHGSVRIRYSLKASTNVTVEIFDVSNNKVKTLLADQSLSAGEHFVPWDGKNGRNVRVANGVYIYQVSTRSGLNAFGKIVVLD